MNECTLHRDRKKIPKTQEQIWEWNLYGNTFCRHGRYILMAFLSIDIEISNLGDGFCVLINLSNIFWSVVLIQFDTVDFVLLSSVEAFSKSFDSNSSITTTNLFLQLSTTSRTINNWHANLKASISISCKNTNPQEMWKMRMICVGSRTYLR